MKQKNDYEKMYDAIHQSQWRKMQDFLTQNPSCANAQSEFNKTSVLMVSCLHGAPIGTKMLLESGADPGHSSKSGETSLLFAARKGDLECFRLVLDKGGNDLLEKVTEHGETLLHSAASNAHADILREVISLAPDYLIHYIDNQGNTALHSAARDSLENSDCLIQLLQAGCDWTIENDDDKTCLDLATPDNKSVIEKYIRKNKLDDAVLDASLPDKAPSI